MDTKETVCTCYSCCLLFLPPAYQTEGKPADDCPSSSQKIKSYFSLDPLCLGSYSCILPDKIVSYMLWQKLGLACFDTTEREEPETVLLAAMLVIFILFFNLLTLHMVGLVIHHVGYSLVPPWEKGLASHIPSVSENDTAYGHLFPDPLLNLFFLCLAVPFYTQPSRFIGCQLSKLVF